MDVHPLTDNTLHVHEDGSEDGLSDFEDALMVQDTEEHESNRLKMLESHSQATSKQNGIYSV